jgi:hypothetical protein
MKKIDKKKRSEKFGNFDPFRWKMQVRLVVMKVNGED